jgi:hypothetical protein
LSRRISVSGSASRCHPNSSANSPSSSESREVAELPALPPLPAAAMASSLSHVESGRLSGMTGAGAMSTTASAAIQSRECRLGMSK